MIRFAFSLHFVISYISSIWKTNKIPKKASVISETGRYNETLIQRISEISAALTEAKNLNEFETLLEDTRC